MNTVRLASLLIFLTVLSSCSEKPNTEPAVDTGQKLLLVSFDGFRYDYLSKTDTPHFDSLLAEGVKAEGLIPVFPSKTFPNHYSIVTGLYPENSGLIANTMYDPQWDAWYKISDREAVENPRWYRGEPIWNTAEKQGLKAGTMFWVGSEAPIQGMRPTYWKTYDGDMPGKARIDTVVKWFGYPDDKAIDLGTLYFELVDDAGHWYGPESDSLVAAVQKADSLIGYLKQELRRAKVWEDLNLVIVSDHGMAQLSGDKIIELDSIIDMDNVEFVLWNPMTMIQPVKGKTDEVYEKLKEAEDHYRVFRKNELPERYHLDDSRRLTDIIMVADMPYTILSKEYKPYFMERLPQGTHGFDNREKAMQGLFVARGPSFRQGITVPPFRNIHLYELMSRVMGLSPASNDGSIDSVKSVLKNAE